MRASEQKRIADYQRDKLHEQHVRRLKRLLRDIHPHILALSVTDQAPEFKRLLARIEKAI